jgi:hypothetical protein
VDKNSGIQVKVNDRNEIGELSTVMDSNKLNNLPSGFFNDSQDSLKDKVNFFDNDNSISVHNYLDTHIGSKEALMSGRSGIDDVRRTSGQPVQRPDLPISINQQCISHQ